MAFRQFQHLNVPEYWERYFTKYPQGMTILESLFEWVSQVDGMSDNVNDWNTYLKEFVEQYDTNLQKTLTNTLTAWKKDGFLDVIINEALKTQMDDLELETNNKLDTFESSLEMKSNSKDVRLKSELIGANDITPDLLGSGAEITLSSIPKPNSVSISAIDKKSKINLFNKNTVTKNTVIENETGNVISSIYGSRSEYIRVSPNTSYVLIPALTSPGALFNENYGYLNTITGYGDEHDYTVFVTPNDASFIVVNTSDIAIDRQMLVLGNGFISDYIKYGSKIDWLKVDEENLQSNSVETKHLKNGSITSDKLFGAETTNLFNKEKTLTGKYVSNTGVLTASTLLYSSDFISVSPGDIITVPIGYTTPGGMYDENYNWVQSIPKIESGVYPGNELTTGWTFTVPAKIYYIITNFVYLRIDEWYVVKSNKTLDNYIPYGFQIKDLYINTKNIIGGNVDGEETVSEDVIETFGDSITWYDGQPYNASTTMPGVLCKGYQSYLREKTGATVNNRGVSGHTMQQIYSVVTAFNFANSNAAILMVGTNNYRDGEENSLGSVLPFKSVFDTTKFTGALQASIEHILTSNQDCKILLFTPIKGWYSTSRTAMSTQIPDKIIEIGKMYNIPVLDLYRTSGINELTGTTYIADSTLVDFRFHPTNKGHKRIAELAIPFYINH